MQEPLGRRGNPGPQTHSVPTDAALKVMHRKNPHMTKQNVVCHQPHLPFDLVLCKVAFEGPGHPSKRPGAKDLGAGGGGKWDKNNGPKDSAPICIPDILSRGEWRSRIPAAPSSDRGQDQAQHWTCEDPVPAREGGQTHWPLGTFQSSLVKAGKGSQSGAILLEKLRHSGQLSISLTLPRRKGILGTACASDANLLASPPLPSPP